MIEEADEEEDFAEQAEEYWRSLSGQPSVEQDSQMDISDRPRAGRTVEDYDMLLEDEDLDMLEQAMQP